MGFPRQVRGAPPNPDSETSCVAVYERELDYLLNTLQRLGANRHDAEDLAHEVFIVLHHNWKDIDLSRPFRPYLFAVAFRVVSAHRRRNRREVPCEYIEAEDQAIGPEEALQSRQSAQLLTAALDAVPLSRRAVVIMHDLDDVPVVEIAARLSITRFGAYARLRKARKELASALRRLLREGIKK